jgi:hypothetical protein
MGWMRFVGFVFNLFGVLFLIGAALFLIFGATLGGIGSNDSTSGLTMLFGGMMGTIGAVTNVAAAMLMFFFGAVMYGLRRVAEESIATRAAIERLAPARTITD